VEDYVGALENAEGFDSQEFGSPGPAPMRKTFGVLRDREGAEEQLSSGAKAHLSIGFTPG